MPTRGSRAGGSAADAKYGEALEKESLSRVFAALSGGTARISAESLHNGLKKLKYKCRRKDVEDINLDNDARKVAGGFAYKPTELLMGKMKLDPDQRALVWQGARTCAWALPRPALGHRTHHTGRAVAS